MRAFSLLALAVVALCTSTPKPILALTANQVLVVYNKSELPPPDDPTYATAVQVISASKGVAEYYAAAREIPSANLIGLRMVPIGQDLTDAQYVAVIARPLWDDYLSKPKYAHIRVIVMCYGVPSHISVNDPINDNHWRSVDDYLTVLGNDGALNADVMRVGARRNPYLNTNMRFDDFRDSPLNRIDMGGGEVWKLNYLVCRLDGYSTPVTPVTVDVDNVSTTYNIPSDVNALIERAKQANAQGRTELTGAQAVLDDAPDIGGRLRHYPDSTETDLNTLLQPVTCTSVHRESEDTFATDVAIDEQDVILYSSNGSYDDAAESVTQCWRPHFTWEAGGIGMYWKVSGTGYWVRTPHFYKHWECAPEADPYRTPYVLKVKLQKGLYPGCLLHLRDNGTVLQSVQFIEDLGCPGGVVAFLDLNDIQFANGGAGATVQCSFPTSDPYHPGELAGEPVNIGLNPQNLETGYTFRLTEGQSLGVELIRDGASGTTANAGEPGGPGMVDGIENGADPNIGLPMYAKGYTWAESAWMSAGSLVWQQLVIGDPLLARFAGKPTTSFEAPSPPDGLSVCGQVTFVAKAQPDGNGNQISSMRVFVTGPDGVRNELPASLWQESEIMYAQCVWDTAAAADGAHTVEVVAYQEGNALGSASTGRTLNVDHATGHDLSITQPAADYATVNATPIVVHPSSGPISVDVWLLAWNSVTYAGQAQRKETGDYSLLLNQATGIYTVVAIAHYLEGDSYTRRTISLANEEVAIQQLCMLHSLGDGSPVYLPSVPVSAGPGETIGPNMDAAFDRALYVEDSAHTGGVRVEYASSAAPSGIGTGSTITIKGVLRTSGNGVTEPYIALSGASSGIWLAAGADMPSPLALLSKNIGGSAGAGAAGVTGGRGACNTGMLVKLCGRVSYIGSDFIYLDDGSRIWDGNTLQGLVKLSPVTQLVPDASQFSTYEEFCENCVYPKDIRVLCGSLAKPALGDCVAVTGISSTTRLEAGGNIVRVVRVRDQADIAPIVSYTRSARAYEREEQPSWHFDKRFMNTNQEQMHAGSRVRLANVHVQGVQRDEQNALIGPVEGRHYDPAVNNKASLMLPLWINAKPNLTMGQSLTVVGTVQQLNEDDDWIQPDIMYIGFVDWREPMLISTAQSAAAEAAMTVTETAAAESESVGGVGSIDWALWQMDGATVDLCGEAVALLSDDGRMLELRELVELNEGSPSLVLCLPHAIPDLAQWNQIDIIGGTLATLTGGQRAISNPSIIYRWRDLNGFPSLLVPKDWRGDGQPELWPWRELIYSR